MNNKIDIGIITLFPAMFTALNHGMPQRAQTQTQLNLHYWRPQDYTERPETRVDDRPYGGGPGMIMRYPPLKNAIDAAKQQLPSALVIHLSPQGEVLTQAKIAELLTFPELILLCSRYEGVDERLLEDEVDREYSVGDYVVSGGELPAMLLIDALARLLPGVLGNPQSATEDSFQNGRLDCPHYTRPETINGKKVPEILQSGNHEAIKHWRAQQSLIRTWQKRPDLLKRQTLSLLEQQLLDDYEENHE